MFEEFKKHWFIGYVLVAVAAMGVTWGALEKLVVGPREFAIAQLQRDVGELNSEIDKLTAEARELRSAAVASGQISEPRSVYDDGVSQGNSATTEDGRLIVKIRSVAGTVITLTTAVGGQAPIDRSIYEGERLTIEDGPRNYYVDAWRVRGNLVDLKIFLAPK